MHDVGASPHHARHRLQRVLDGTTNTIVTTVMPNIGDVKADIGGSAITGAVTSNVSKAIASLGMALAAGHRPGLLRHGDPVQLGAGALVILSALPLAIIGAFVGLAVIGHATNIITGLAVSLQAVALPVTVIAAGMWIAYSVGGGLYGVALTLATAPHGCAVVTRRRGPKPSPAGWSQVNTSCAGLSRRVARSSQ